MDLPSDILTIAKQFMAGVSIKYITSMITASLKHGIDKSWQQQLLQSTVQSPLVLKYPPSNKYQSLFLKSLIEKLEISKIEAAEEIYELYASLMQSTSKDENYSYKIYSMEPELNVILKESTSFISQGTTGLVTWQAAKLLTEWSFENKDLLNGKNVLELGCGVGLTGIVVSKACLPNSYCFTDCHPQVLDILRHNLEVNFTNLCDQLKAPILTENAMDICHWGSTQISLTPFHWDDDAAIEAILLNFKPDVILAADVIYDTSIIRCLVKVLKILLKNRTQNRNDRTTVAYIACTLRNEDTLNTFYEDAGLHGIQCEELPNPAMKLFLYEMNTPMKILKLCIKA